MRKLALFALLGVSTSWVCAQQPSPAGHAAGHPQPAATGIHSAHDGARNDRRFGNPANPFPRFPHGAFLLPLLSDWFDPTSSSQVSPQDLYSSGYPVASQLPFVVQNAPPQGESFDRQYDRQPQAESLLIELHGDQYVSVNTGQSAGSNDEQAAPSGLQGVPALHKNSNQPAAKDFRRAPAASTDDARGNLAPNVAAGPGNAPPPVTLILRDGTHQQVRDYTIANGNLYARGDFYADGYWNKTIQLSALNIPETLSANAAQGIKFHLPSAPNEVIVGP